MHGAKVGGACAGKSLMGRARTCLSHSRANKTRGGGRIGTGHRPRGDFVGQRVVETLLVGADHPPTEFSARYKWDALTGTKSMTTKAVTATGQPGREIANKVHLRGEESGGDQEGGGWLLLL